MRKWGGSGGEGERTGRRPLHPPMPPLSLPLPLPPVPLPPEKRAAAGMPMFANAVNVNVCSAGTTPPKQKDPCFVRLPLFRTTCPSVPSPKKTTGNQTLSPQWRCTHTPGSVRRKGGGIPCSETGKGDYADLTWVLLDPVDPHRRAFWRNSQRSWPYSTLAAVSLGNAPCGAPIHNGLQTEHPGGNMGETATHQGHTGSRCGGGLEAGMRLGVIRGRRWEHLTPHEHLRKLTKRGRVIAHKAAW